MGSYPLVVDDLQRGNLIAPFGFIQSGHHYVALTGADNSGETRIRSDPVVAIASSQRLRAQVLASSFSYISQVQNRTPVLPAYWCVTHGDKQARRQARMA